MRIKPGEDLTLNSLRMVQRDTVAVHLRFPAYVTRGTSINSVHFADGSSSMTFGGGFGSRQVETERVGEERVFDLTRGVHDVMVNWGTLGGSQNYSGILRIDATGAAVTHELVAAPLVRVRMTTSLLRDGAQADLPPGLRCYLRSKYQLIPAACTGETHVPAGLYDLKLDDLPHGAYIAGAAAANEDLLSGKIAIENDINIAMQIRTPGAIVQGTVRGPDGAALPHAVVALVPGPPARHTFYRSAISDISGHYELSGIAPGTYQLFAWPDLEGAAYRNAEFMRPYEGRGQEIRIEADESVSINMTSF